LQFNLPLSELLSLKKNLPTSSGVGSFFMDKEIARVPYRVCALCMGIRVKDVGLDVPFQRPKG